MNYYNEIDPFAAGWLRNLIAARLIPDGRVDERSIVNVSADELGGYEQCHFFAGIAGWPYALGLAEWEGTVWTGSCPCQPLSSAGQRKGHADERHLWPAFYRLIAECRPPTIFGEQVASKDGREWLAGVRADLEALGYAVGAADLCAAGAGAPHIRQRLFWVADATDQRRGECRELAASQGNGIREISRQRDRFGLAGSDSATGGLGAAAGSGRRDNARSEETSGIGLVSELSGFWSNSEWLPCLDGKARRIEPTIQPLAAGISTRVGLLRGSGNSIVPKVAAEFVRAFRETR
jgi:DNA (cytosine-5)-methyltransferase 1